MMNWTDQQYDAIYRDDANILVSAAAGSGKTTVLIERIARLITDEEVDVDRFLITTFTNAAASEMKERLKKKIDKKIEECGDDTRKVEFLQAQIRLLADAHIETFHSFAISIIRDYFFLTDLQPGFAIGDETRINLMKKEVIDGVFEDRFREDGDRFKAFLRKYSRERNDERLKENILSIYTEMLSIPRYISWADRQVGHLNDDSPIESLGIIDFIAARTKAGLKDAADCYFEAARLLDREETENIHRKALDDARTIRSLADNIFKEDEDVDIESIDKAGELIRQIKLNTMRATKDEQDDYELVKEEVQTLRKRGKKHIDDLKNTFLGTDMEKQDEAIKGLHEDTEYYLGIIKDLEKKLAERKKDENIIDFDDALHYAIKILDDERAAEDYKNRFRFIFIDEYQDSNYLQEEIIGRIKGDKNLFMVGDIKQSIYRFRLAEPGLFRSKYVEYGRDEEEGSAKIDLSNNFRSKGNIRGAVNAIFSDLMDGYDDKAALRGPEGGGPAGPPVELHVIRKQKIEDHVDEEREHLSEAALIASIIRKSIGKTFVDKDGKEKTLKYGDIAVLSRGGRAISQIESYLNNEDIPAYGETAGGYYETVEVRVFIDLLRVISNIRQDVPLIAVMSAVFFDFYPSELARIRISFREGSFFDGVMRYAQEGEDEALREKIVSMLDQIERWREMSRTLPLEELIRILLYETGYYDYCNGLPVGKRRVSNLRLLMEKAASFEKTSYSGLYGFLSYVEAMKNSRQKVNEASAVGEGDDVVRVMTVHKSKGLEYPMVILAGAGKRISGSSSGFDPAMDREFSIGLPFIDKKLHTRAKTLLQYAIGEKKKSEELEEEIRILYVALTRAIDRLIVVGTLPESKNISSVPMKGSFIEMIYPALDRISEDSEKAIIYFYNDLEIEPGSPGSGSGESGEHAEEIGHVERVESEERIEDAEEERGSNEEWAEIDRRLSFTYPHSRAVAVRPKYTVTGLAAGLKDHGEYDEGDDEDEKVRVFPGEDPDLTKLPPAMPRIPELKGLREDREEMTAAEKGTVMHYIMEKIDFQKALDLGESYVAGIAEELHERGVLDDASYDIVSPGDIAAFFRDPVGQRAAKAEKLKREKEFLMEETMEGETVIVQGVIDCCFEEEDGLVLIDYKNSYLAPGEDPGIIVDRYREQIRLYKKALEKAEEKPVKEAWIYLFKNGKFLPVNEI